MTIRVSSIQEHMQSIINKDQLLCRDVELGNRGNSGAVNDNDSSTLTNTGFENTNYLYADNTNPSIPPDSEANLSTPKPLNLFECMKKSIKREKKQRRQRRMKVVKDKKECGLISIKNAFIKDEARQAIAKKKKRNQHGQFQSA